MSVRHLVSDNCKSCDNISDIQGGSNMTGTDLYVNKPHCAAAVRPWESEATTFTSLLLGLEPVQSCLGVARVMSEQKVPRSVEQRVVIKFLVGENVPSAEIHHILQQQYGEECLLWRVEVVASLSQGHTAAVQCGLFTYKSVPVIFEPPCINLTGAMKWELSEWRSGTLH